MARHGANRLDHTALLLVAGSGVLTGLSYLYMEFYLAWFCLIPLLYVLERKGGREALLWCALYGVITASILYSWVIPVATRYSGVFTYYSLVLYGIAVFYFSLYCAAFGLGYSFLHRHSRNRIISGISIAALFVLLEMIRVSLFPGSPWFHYNLALTQARLGWIIQWAAVGGLSLIVFALVLFNYLATHWLLTKDVVLLRTATAVLAVFFLGGALLSVARDTGADEPYAVVLLNDNFPAEARWDDRTGDSLAAVLFRMNDEAARYDPDLIVWSETAIPWTLESTDEFIPTVLRITRRSKADHILGIWSPSAPNSKLVYNSAYLVTNSGNIADRYDKTLLLDVLEKPFGDGVLSALPFLNTSRYDNILPGTSRSVMTSGKAQIGVLICNESLSEAMYAGYEKAGANLLVVMSNDAWFENTPLQMHHFYIAGIGAVMSGRDVVINSNRGIAGIVRRNGAIDAFPRSDTARVVKCTPRLSSSTTVYSHIRDVTVPLYAMLACLSIVIGRK
jgi:apolipoprotein N-acyltransferase